jgi:hypothetical protein
MFSTNIPYVVLIASSCDTCLINFNFLDLIALKYQVTSTNYGVPRHVIFCSCWLPLLCYIFVLKLSEFSSEKAIDRY